MTYYPKIGSVSEGTLRTEDLLDTFSSELSYHMKRMRLTREQRKRYRELIKDALAMSGDQDGHPDNEACQDDIVQELQDALGEIAPPYAYFGTTEGDGACFGFWPAIDLHDEPVRVAEVEREHWGEDVVIVSDHGNATCGHVDKRGKFHEYWSCV